MELGLCAPIDKAREAREAGFDYLECPLVSLLANEDDAAFAPVLKSYAAAELPVRAFNLFLPSTHKVTGPEVDWNGLQRYVERALKRAAEVGASRVVFGSGGARNVPEGFPPDEALEQLVRFLRYAGDVAAEAGIVIAIEPLRRQETNLINTVADGVKLAERVGRSAVRVLADFYHMAEEQEPLKHLVDYRDWLEHVHVADTGRHAPGTGSYPYPAVRSAPEPGRLSRQDLSRVPLARLCCRSADQRAVFAQPVQALGGEMAKETFAAVLAVDKANGLLD